MKEDLSSSSYSSDSKKDATKPDMNDFYTALHSTNVPKDESEGMSFFQFRVSVLCVDIV